MSAAHDAQTAPRRPDDPLPEWLAVAARPSLNLSLRQIMLLLVYCSVLSLIGRHAYVARTLVDALYLAIAVGLGVAYLGVWLVPRLGTFGYVGWAVFVLGFGLMTVPTMGFLAIPGIVVLVGILVGLHVLHRRNQQSGLLWVLAVAADRRIPLAPGVEAFAQQSSGIDRDRALALAANLRRGQSLSAAVGRVNRVVPWDVPLLIRVGEQVDRLAAGLRVAADSRSRRQHSTRVVLDRAAYLIVILVLIEVVIGVATLKYNVVQTFEAIFRDLTLTLPPSTRLLAAVDRFVKQYAWQIGLSQALLAASVLFVLATQGFQGIPILGRLARLRHKSLLLRSLALVVEADRPLAAGFAVLAADYPSRQIRRRLREASESIRGGGEWLVALRSVGLLNPGDLGVLEAAGRAGNLPWAIRALAEAGERRFAYRLVVASQLAFVGAVVALGAVVLFLSLALFLPLIEMIERLS